MLCLHKRRVCSEKIQVSKIIHVTKKVCSSKSMHNIINVKVNTQNLFLDTECTHTYACT